ncbi:hypothetical protein FRC14_007705 [Serendipita sp. 396]|nr:hypothetical protein FRC14_007705 [Serendipita sp. 396]KAG8798093.1 hypothetical protein FRC16_008038 [Serendipita sp. 398]
MEEISEAPHIPSWRNSDDWVNRTGGLRLDSPLPWTIPNDHIQNFHPRESVQYPTIRQDMHPNEPTYLPTPKDSPIVMTNDIDFNERIANDEDGPTGSFIPQPQEQHDQPNDQMMLSPTMKPLPLEKKRVVMGYREDCESCRMRIPGHYMHLI